MSKILIAAHNLCHAEYYAREVLHIARANWTFIKDDWQIRGFRGRELILVEAHRHFTTKRQKEDRYALLICCEALEVTVKKVFLS